MIRVGIRRDRDGRVRELSCTGHARFDAEGGVDIVCAGVSALLGALAIGLTEVVRAPVSLDASDGSMRFRIPARLPEGQSASVQVLLETTVRALEDLQEHYAGFVRVRLLRPR